MEDEQMGMGMEVFEFEGMDLGLGDDAADENEDVQSTITSLLEEAIAHYDENLEPDQVDATDYYHGRPFGDEQEGRSQVVSTEVRDATLSQMAGLMKVFTGSDRVVEFRPDGAEDTPVAEMQSEYVNYIFMEDNPGYLILDSIFKDALIRRVGIAKWYWDEDPTPHGAEFTGLSQEQLYGLVDDDEVEDVEVTDQDDSTGVPLFSASVLWREAGKVKVVAIPNEEFVFTPDAQSLEDAGIVAHVREVPQSELIGMGISADIVEEHAGTHLAPRGESDLTGARQYHGGVGHQTFGVEAGDDSRRPVVFAEVYAKIDVDGDGLSELRRFECIGPQFKIVNGTPELPGELVDDVPFAVFTPILEPHTIVGLSNYDLLRDIQKIKSQIERGTLNSLAKAIDPPMEVVNNEVNMRDVLNPEISGVIRVRRPGMLREVATQFIGGASMPMLEYYNEKRADRIGMTRASEGLDPDALQSSTAEAVGATLSRSQQMQEMIARNFAETGMRRMFSGILKLVVEHQDFAREVELRGQFMEIDPRSWHSDRHVTIGSALGSGTPQERMAALERISAKQSELQAMGSPLVGTVEIRNTLRRWTDLAGYRNTDEFFKPWGPQEEAQAAQAASQAPPPPPTMEEQLIEVEQAKVEAKMQVDQMKLEMERWKASMEDDRARDKQAMDAALREKELELKHNVDIEDAELRAMVAGSRNTMDADVKMQVAQRDAAAAPPPPPPPAAPVGPPQPPLGPQQG